MEINKQELIQKLELFMILNGKKGSKVSLDTVYSYHKYDLNIRYIKSVYFNEEVLEIKNKEGEIIFIGGSFDNFYSGPILNDNSFLKAKQKLEENYLFGVEMEMELKIKTIDKLQEKDLLILKLITGVENEI